MTDSAKTIIIVDDYETYVMYMSILLRRMGFKVLSAKNGSEALRLLNVVIPDILILDVAMPDIDGVSILQKIRATEQTSELPVIIITGISSVETKDECEKFGCSAYLTKPVNVLDLNRIIYQFIEFPCGQKRRHLRTCYNEIVKVRYENLEKQYYAVSLSEGGIYLRAKQPLPVGSIVEVAINTGKDETVKLNGKVIYQKDIFSSAEQIDPGMAIEFIDITKKDMEKLKKLVQEKLAGDLVMEQDEEILMLE